MCCCNKLFIFRNQDFLRDVCVCVCVRVRVRVRVRVCVCVCGKQKFGVSIFFLERKRYCGSRINVTLKTGVMNL